MAVAKVWNSQSNQWLPLADGSPEVVTQSRLEYELSFKADVGHAHDDRYEIRNSGMIIPNATVGTDVVQFTTGAAWTPMYYAGAMKIGPYFEGANFVTSSGAQWVEITRGGMYMFEVLAVITFPGSTAVGYGIITEALSNAGMNYFDAHNHEVPYASTGDYKLRTFLRRCVPGDRVAPVFYMSAGTGNISFVNQTFSRSHFTFARVAP